MSKVPVAYTHVGRAAAALVDDIQLTAKDDPQRIDIRLVGLKGGSYKAEIDPTAAIRLIKGLERALTEIAARQGYTERWFGDLVAYRTRSAERLTRTTQ